jgi:hypothetical protein
MAAGHQQREKREARRIRLQQGCQQVSFQMMDAQHRLIPGQPQTGGESRPHQQGADETGSGGVGHCVNRPTVGIGIGKRLPNQRQQPANVVAGGEFRHYPAIGLVHGDLAVQPVRQQPQAGVVDRDRRLIAGTLNTDDAHKPP